MTASGRLYAFCISLESGLWQHSPHVLTAAYGNMTPKAVTGQKRSLGVVSENGRWLNGILEKPLL